MSTRQAICFVLLLKDWNCGTVLLTLVVVERLELLGQRVADHPDAPEPDDGQRRPERRRRTAGRLADVGGGHVAAALAGVDDAAAVDAGGPDESQLQIRRLQAQVAESVRYADNWTT